MVRNIIFTLLVAIGATQFVWADPVKATATSKSPTPADALKGLRANKDEMRDITFYEHPATPKYRNANSIHFYFGKSKDGRFADMRFVMQYYADDWLFIQKAWAKADGATIELPSAKKFSGWERDNSGGRIWEWSDVSLSQPSEIAALRQMVTAKSVTVRYEGRQYYKDVKLTEKQLKAMRDMIAAYEGGAGKPWK